MERIRTLVNNGGDPDLPDSNGETPLFIAARNGHAETVRALLREFRERIDVDSVTIDGATPLSAAVDNYNVDCLCLLLEHNADPNKVRNNGTTPLYEAVSRRELSLVTALLQYRANPNEPGHRSTRTPLAVAADFGDVEILRALLEHGADPNGIRTNSLTPLYKAASGNKTEAVRVLLEHNADVHKANSAGQTPLYTAATQCDVKHTDTLRLLLEAKALPDAPTGNGKTALLHAASAGSTNVVRVLLEHGADARAPVNARALCAAAGRGYSQVVRLLLEHRAGVETRDAEERTALHLAAKMGSFETILELIEAGADVNAVIPENLNTPLGIISNREQDTYTLCALLKAGADCSMADFLGNTPLHNAAGRGNAHMVRKLLEHGAAAAARNFSGETPLHLAASHGHTDAVGVLLEVLSRTAACSARDVDGRTPLYNAATIFKADIVRALCEAGADVEAACNAGRRPLGAAACGVNPDTVRALCDAGAQVNAAGDEGRTALYLAARYSHVDTARALCEAGADPSQSSDDGSTPLDEAAAAGSNALVWMLVRDFGADPTGLQRARDKAMESALAFSRMDLPEDVVKSILLPLQNLLADGWLSPEARATASNRPHTATLLAWMEDLLGKEAVYQGDNAAALSSGPCSICHNPFTNPVACIPCGHCFCRGCWERWNRANPGQCAYCRGAVAHCVPAYAFPAQRRLFGV